MVGRPVQLEDSTTMMVVVEQSQLRRLDKVAGFGNRSAYIRHLIDTIDERQVQKLVNMEAKIKILRELPGRLEKELLKKDVKIEMLQQLVKQLKAGKPVDFKDVPGMEEATAQYRKWRKSLELRGIEVTKGKELDWVKIRAKDVDVDPRELVMYLSKIYKEDLVGWVE